jgi:hypothetical protein
MRLATVTVPGVELCGRGVGEGGGGVDEELGARRAGKVGSAGSSPHAGAVRLGRNRVAVAAVNCSRR